MTNKERLRKLEQAVSLIRDVEFSYEYGTPNRSMIYRVMVESFSITDVGQLMTELRNDKSCDDGHNWIHYPGNDRDLGPESWCRNCGVDKEGNV